MKRMIISLKGALARRGLSLHPSKCKVQTIDADWKRRGAVELEAGFSVEILGPDESLTLLGTVLNLADPTEKELEHRLASSWRLFWGMKPLLLNSSASATTTPIA